MKKIFLLLIFPILTNITWGQQKQEAEKLVDEGVAFHDKGDYEGAIDKYDKALDLDKDNLLALAEKSFSLTSLKKYEDAIVLCKKAIEKHPYEDGLKTIFVTYGNALDDLKKSDQSIKVYDEGLKLFPEYYQLYFNKGITLSSVNKNEEALLCFQKAIIINPAHAGSNNSMARILVSQNKNIPALFASCRSLTLEPQGDKAKRNLALVQTIMKANIKQTGKNSLTINIDPKMLEDTTSNGKTKDNNFNLSELMLNMTSVLDYDDKNVKKTDAEQFIRKFESLCSSVDEVKNKNHGFYWEYYVPYFIEMKKQNLIEPFAYIAFASSEKENISIWLKLHQTEIDKFYEWSKNYKWVKK